MSVCSDCALYAFQFAAFSLLNSSSSSYLSSSDHRVTFTYPQLFGPATGLPRANSGGAMASDGGQAEPHRKSRKTEVGVDQQETESEAEGLDVDQQLQYIREGSPSDGRIGWEHCRKDGATAASVVSQLLAADQKRVAHVKVGYTGNPYWRFTTLPENAENTVEPHYLRWSHMVVLWGGSGEAASGLERKLILEFTDSPKLQNVLPGADGPIGEVGFTYVLWNSLDEVVGHANCMNNTRRVNTFCSHCKMMIVELKNYHGRFGTACACSSRRFPTPQLT